MICFDDQLSGRIEGPARRGHGIAWRHAAEKVENGLQIPRRLIRAAWRGAHAEAVGSFESPGVERRCRHAAGRRRVRILRRSEEHTSELQSLMRISYAVFCLTKT